MDRQIQGVGSFFCRRKSRKTVRFHNLLNNLMVTYFLKRWFHFQLKETRARAVEQWPVGPGPAYVTNYPVTRGIITINHEIRIPWWTKQDFMGCGKGLERCSGVVWGHVFWLERWNDTGSTENFTQTLNVCHIYLHLPLNISNCR